MAMELDRERLDAYHRKNVRVILVLLAVWFAVSLGGILAVRFLDQFTVFDFPLGYWLGAQGSLLVFIAEVFVYAKFMDRLDREHGFAED